MRNEIKRIITEKVWVSILALCLAKSIATDKRQDW